MTTQQRRSSSWFATFALVFAVLALPRGAGAAGFGLYEAGTRALGLGGAYTGLADTPSALFFNPAGLALQRGLSIEGNIALILPNFAYDTTVPGTATPISVEGEQNVFTVPSIYVNYRLHDRVAIGLGTYVPFGLGVEWAKTYDNNGTSIPWWGRNAVQKIELQTVFLNVSVAAKLHERVYIGAGFVVGIGAVQLERSVTLSNNRADDINLDLSGDDVGFGATAGLLVRVIPGLLNVGVSYKSAVRFNFTGNAAFSQNGSPNIPAGLRSTLIDGKVEAPITLPHTISFGVTAFPMERLVVGLNVDIVTWSSYEKLEVKFVDNPQLSSSERKDWSNTFQLRVGAEYKVLEDNLPVRLGFIYDQSPVPDDTVGPELPDTDRYWVSLGVGYRLYGVQADLAYQFLITSNDATADTAPIVGSRSATAHILALGLGYNFDL
jgi:long-chain fatty acid transport protein